MKRFCLILVSMMIMLIFTGCGNSGQQQSSTTAKAKVKVIATVYPVYEFAKQIGGDKVEVEMLVPPGAEPHDWEPKAKDLAKIKSAKLFLYHGAGLEPWSNKLLSREVLGDVPALEAAQGIRLIEDEGRGEDQHGSDPHIWLDPVLAQQEVNNIAAALAQVDPGNKEYYQVNAQKYNAELANLDNEYREVLANISRRDIVTSHNAFGYLAQRYNLYQKAIMGLSPDAEPTPEKMAQVVKFCREHFVKYIFFETLVSPKLAQTIAQETGAQILVLNPIEGLAAEDMKAGKNYVSLMRENLTNLKKSLSD